MKSKTGRQDKRSDLNNLSYSYSSTADVMNLTTHINTLINAKPDTQDSLTTKTSFIFTDAERNHYTKDSPKNTLCKCTFSCLSVCLSVLYNPPSLFLLSSHHFTADVLCGVFDHELWMSLWIWQESMFKNQECALLSCDHA